MERTHQLQSGFGELKPIAASRRESAKELQIALLGCGPLAVLIYIAANLVAPAFYPGYEISSRTVSELSAIGAPTRGLWIAMMVPYTLLMIGFGFGVLRSAARSSALSAVGILLIVNTVVGISWPPMHMRGNPMTITDTLHIAFAVFTVGFFVLQMVIAAAGLEGIFRRYTFVSLAVMLVFGGLTGLESPALAANFPTPMIGVWERISIGAYMLWLFVFAILLAREDNNILNSRTTS
jgi:hypothetical protein